MQTSGSTTTARAPGRVVVIGAGPGGMATALACHRVGLQTQLFERYPEIKAAGNILNLWPPPQKVLRLIGVDTEDLGAPCHTEFQRADGRLRADVRLTNVRDFPVPRRHRCARIGLRHQSFQEGKSHEHSVYGWNRLGKKCVFSPWRRCRRSGFDTSERYRA